MAIKITGVGSYIPKKQLKNDYFLNHEFFNPDGTRIKDDNQLIIKKFEAITGIEERRYAEENITTSDMASFAAKKAIEDADIDPETLDYIIVAHNFGDILHNTNQGDMVPSLGTRVKHQLKIKKPSCVAFDLVFGCPGWLEGVIQAKAYIQAGMAKKCLVIGAETLSRVVDVNDRDSMIYGDGAGAVVVEESNEDREMGILAHESATYSYEEAYYLGFKKSYDLDKKEETRYIKMTGRRIYNFALSHVPQAMKSCLEKSKIPLENVKKIFLHQANEKMDDAICERFYKLYDAPVPENIMPMSIRTLGNSSVATLPTLMDLVKRNQIDKQEIQKGDVIIYASVGAGMNINAMVYKI